MTTISPDGLTGASRATTTGGFALVGIATILTAIIANSLVYFVGRIVVSYDPDFIIFQNVSPTIIFTVVPAIVSVLLYGLLRRFTTRPERTFTILAAVVLVLSIVPDLTYIPTVEGASAGQTAILIVMHLVAAITITGMLTRLAPRDSRRS